VAWTSRDGAGNTADNSATKTLNRVTSLPWRTEELEWWKKTFW
jgi:hypothetical protein